MRPEGLGKCKKKKLVRYRTRDLPACSLVVSFTTRPLYPRGKTPRTQYSIYCTVFKLAVEPTQPHVQCVPRVKP
jgi:hypothetical protein